MARSKAARTIPPDPACPHQEAQAFTVRVNVMRGWRRDYCADCLAAWLKSKPALYRHSRITITNYPA